LRRLLHSWAGRSLLPVLSDSYNPNPDTENTMQNTPTDLAGKSILVTGASSGIGAATALALGRAGPRGLGGAPARRAG